MLRVFRATAESLLNVTLSLPGGLKFGPYHVLFANARLPMRLESDSTFL